MLASISYEICSGGKLRSAGHTNSDGDALRENGEQNGDDDEEKRILSGNGDLAFSSPCWVGIPRASRARIVGGFSDGLRMRVY